MASAVPTLRPLSCWKSLLRHARRQKVAARSITTIHYPKATKIQSLPPSMMTPHTPIEHKKKIKNIPPPRSAAASSKDPVSDLQAAQIAVLDPTGARTTLFSRTNPDSAKVGDILLVRLKSGDPFAGVCINIRRRGVDTGILLRNHLIRVGVEMWYKIYSPNVEGIEVVQRAAKRARRARLTYMRKAKHDMGSVQNIVYAYQKSKKVPGSTMEERSRGGKSKSKSKKR